MLRSHRGGLNFEKNYVVFKVITCRSVFNQNKCKQFEELFKHTFQIYFISIGTHVNSYHSDF